MTRKPLPPLLQFYDKPDVTVINPFNFGAGGSPSWSFLGSAMASGQDGAATAGIDTSGANLIILGVSSWSAQLDVVVADSLGNTWIALTPAASGGGAKVYLFYCYAPTVGSGHTFSFVRSTSYGAIIAAAFSGAGASPFDAESGATSGGGATISPGSITPASAPALVVTLAGVGAGSDPNSIDSGFTLIASQAGGASFGIGMAYKVQGATSVNPVWSFSPSVSAAVIASFK